MSGNFSYWVFISFDLVRLLEEANYFFLQHCVVFRIFVPNLLSFLFEFFYFFFVTHPSPPRYMAVRMTASHVSHVMTTNTPPHVVHV